MFIITTSLGLTTPPKLPVFDNLNDCVMTGQSVSYELAALPDVKHVRFRCVPAVFVNARTANNDSD